MIRRYKVRHNDIKNQKLNNNHPAIASVELLILYEEKLSFKEAWGVVYNTFSYKIYTVLPEALEKWSLDI
jgi:starch phosphorylase